MAETKAEAQAKAEEQNQTKRQEAEKRAAKRPGATSNREQNARGEEVNPYRDGTITHGGVQQIGPFDYEQQEADRAEEAEKFRGHAHLNAEDPALPTVDEEALDADQDEPDRDSDANAEVQGDLPSNESNQAH